MPEKRKSSSRDRGTRTVAAATRIAAFPGVCGGNPCIAGTRIPVWVLERARQLGATNKQLLEMYPELVVRDLIAAWRYARLHADEINREIQENEDF
jgi:uncharacterized protein (DUF433 family)